MFRELLDGFDNAISDRMDEYDAVFWRELEIYVAEIGLVASENAAGVQRCPAEYYPTHPGIRTKSYSFGLRVHLNGPYLNGAPVLMGERDGLVGTEGIPAPNDLDVEKMRNDGWQNKLQAYSTHPSSSYCSWPDRSPRLADNARFAPSLCEKTAAYTGYLMSDTFTDLDDYRFRGYWIVPPLIDPNAVELVSAASANAYGNSIGRLIHFESRRRQSAGDTHAVRCESFDYIMPLNDGDEEAIDDEIMRAEQTHQRTGPKNFIFVRR